MQINLIVYHKICFHGRVEDGFVFISIVLKFYLLSAVVHPKLCVSVLRQKDGASQRHSNDGSLPIHLNLFGI